jgi:hypothetical protein
VTPKKGKFLGVRRRPRGSSDSLSDDSGIERESSQTRSSVVSPLGGSGSSSGGGGGADIREFKSPLSPVYDNQNASSYNDDTSSPTESPFFKRNSVGASTEGGGPISPVYDNLKRLGRAGKAKPSQRDSAVCDTGLCRDSLRGSVVSPEYDNQLYASGVVGCDGENDEKSRCESPVMRRHSSQPPSYESPPRFSTLS